MWPIARSVASGSPENRPLPRCSGAACQADPVHQSLGGCLDQVRGPLPDHGMADATIPPQPARPGRIACGAVDVCARARSGRLPAVKGLLVFVLVAAIAVWAGALLDEEQSLTV